MKALAFRDTPFANLMNKRIYNVLLIATKYDAFMLEDDGRVDEQIFNEYTSLSLSSPPRFTQVTTEAEALKALADRNFELVICMPNMDNRDIFVAAKEIKQRYPQIPIVVLTPFSREVSKRVANEDLSAIDYVFSWLGNSELLLAIIKLVEDKMNAPYDTASVGVQIILLVEDSIRSYSSALPLLYRFVLEQSQEFSKEALNGHLQTLRMRGRPKIKLARNYEEAVRIFERYKDNMLGIISDMSFMRAGKKDPYAGYKFGRYVRQSGLIIPFILESSDVANEVYADELKASFIDKNSKAYPQMLVIQPETSRTVKVPRSRMVRSHPLHLWMHDRSQRQQLTRDTLQQLQIWMLNTRDRNISSIRAFMTDEFTMVSARLIHLLRSSLVRISKTGRR